MPEFIAREQKESVGRRPSGDEPLRERSAYYVDWRERNRFGSAPTVPATGGWNPDKVATFRESFYEFLGYVRINSKEKGGDFCLAEGIYEAQYRLLDAVFDGLAEDIHDFKCLKSRQLGVSTISRALMIFWLGMHRGMQGAMIFDTEAHKEEAREEIEQMIASLPVELGFPKIVKLNRYNLLLGNNSRLRFMAAGVKSTKSSGVLGRSSGINLVHASEICSWENEEGVIALKNSLSRNYPDRLYLYESTARGYNQWHDMWEEAKQDDLNQRTVFIGWWSKEDQRISRADTAKWERYGADPPTERELERIGEVSELYGFDIDAEQLAWYRQLVDPTRDRDEDEPEDSYQLQDQPWTEGDAFQMPGSTFFEAQKLKERAEAASRKRYQGYKFSPGTDFVMTEIIPAATWRDIDIKIWEEPVHDAVYVVSADPAFGHSPDSNHSAVQVGRCYADQIEQVAEFTSTSTLTHQLAYLIWALVGYYGTPPNNHVLVIIEINGPGESVWREYGVTRAIVQNGYLRPAARDKGLTDLFYNARNYIYSRSDSMHPGHNYHWKCLSVDEPLPTPMGWTTMGEVQVGDRLFDEKGESCTVTVVSDVEEDHECFEVIFDDKSSIIADAGHLWQVQDGAIIKTTDFIAGFHSIDVAKPLKLPDLDVPIDPYVLGVWLGNGFAETGRYCHHTDDIEEISEHLINAGAQLDPIIHEKEKKVSHQNIIGLRRLLREHELLNNKHIPLEYLRSSFRQRLSLLQGLLDTDGSIDNQRQCSFSTSNIEIAFGFSELLRTLGIKAKKLGRFRPLSNTEAFQFWFTAYPDMPLFRLKRKLDRQRLDDGGEGKGGPGKPRYKRTRRHQVIDVVAVPSVPVRCVQVDSPSRLYLAGIGMVPTHNTNHQLKVAVMERLRDFVHNGGIIINSLEAIEEMKGVTRDGDQIGAEGSRRDDRTVALAMMVRAWEEKLRRGLISQNRTKEADVARRRMNIVDQFQLFNRYRLSEMFRRKDAIRQADAFAAQRAALRSRSRNMPRQVRGW